MTIRMSQEEKKFLEKSIKKMVEDASKDAIKTLEKKMNILNANLLQEKRKAAVLASKNQRLERKVRTLESAHQQLSESLRRR